MQRSRGKRPATTSPTALTDSPCASAASAEARGAIVEHLGPVLRTLLELEGEDAERFDELLERIVAVELRAVGEHRRRHHREELDPLLDEAREFLCTLEERADCLFAPPALFAWIADGRWPSRGVRVDYLGHGLHYSLVRQKSP